MLNVGRKYLTWIQNSVFEGEITDAKFEKLKLEIKKKIDLKADSVIFYINRTSLYMSKEVVGQERNPVTNIL